MWREQAYPRRRAGLSTSRRNRKDHAFYSHSSSSIRNSLGGFDPASRAHRDSRANPYASVLSRRAVERALASESFPVFTSSVGIPDIKTGSRLLKGQAVKSFLNNVKPNALEKIYQFVGRELTAMPQQSESCLEDLQRLQILSTAWQALNDSLPQFQGTFEDMREAFDARVDALRMSLLFQENLNNATSSQQLENSESETEVEHSPKLRSSLRGIRTHKKAKEQRDGVFRIARSDTNSQEPSESSDGRWASMRSLGLIKSFWESTNQLQSCRFQGSNDKEQFLHKTRLVRIPFLMASMHQLTSSLSSISRTRGQLLVTVWHRAMVLVELMCKHANSMQTHHLQVIKSLEDLLDRHYEYLRANDMAGNRYMHELRTSELQQQNQISEQLGEKTMEIQLLKERSKTLSRMKNTLKRLVNVYKRQRSTAWHEEQRSALEEQISTVASGSLTTALDKQQERLQMAKLAETKADLLATMHRATQLMHQIKLHIRRSMTSSTHKDISVQTGINDHSWTVQEGSMKKIAPSKGWWTLHQNASNKKLASEFTSRRNHNSKSSPKSKFDLSGNGTKESQVGIPSKFERLLTFKALNKPVQSMAKISFLRLVHAIYGSMMESWKELTNFSTTMVKRSKLSPSSPTLSKDPYVGSEKTKEENNSRPKSHSSNKSSSARVVPLLMSSEGWESAVAVSDFVYDYLLLQFGIAELSEPKLLQLLATAYRKREKLLRAKAFCWFCGITKPTNMSGKKVENLPSQYEEDALRFYLGAYAQLQSAHSTGRCIEIVKKSMLYAELDVAIDVVYDIFGLETDATQQSIIDVMRSKSEDLKIEKAMLGIDHRLSGKQKGSIVQVIDVDVVLDVWLTRWTMGLSRTRKRFQILFVASDVNEDGRLSYREFSSVLRAIAPNVESYQIAELFRGCLRQTSSGAEIDCESFTDFLTRSTTLMAPSRWEGQVHANGANGGNALDQVDADKDYSCMQMYGPPASHYYDDVSRTVRLLRESSVRYRDIIQKHLDWIIKHARTPEEKWDSEHCAKRLDHFERLFEHALDGRDSAELAWQAFRLLRHETETIRRSRTILSHTMAPIHLVSRFRSKMTETARKMKSRKLMTQAGALQTSTDAIHSGNDHSNPSSQADANVQVFSLVRWHHVDKLLRMIDFGEVDVDVSNHHGNTLLHVACQNGHLDIARMLCRKGISVDAQNCRGNTALHFTRYYDYSEIFRLLRESGADDTIRNQDGETCYELRAQGLSII